MLLPEDQRRLLGAFIRTRREALTPDRSGRSSPHGRRRTPGLRREEVAQLCGLSTTWYTWIEQGRDIALSAEALARLADGLSLSAAERSYLFELTRRRDPSPPAGLVPDSIPPALLDALRATATPAYLLDRLWAVRGSNPAAGRLFAPWFGSHEPCLLRYVFLNETAATFIVDWENRAKRLVAEFRSDTAHHPDDLSMKNLIDELLDGSAAFARLWNDHAVLAREGGARAFNHPQDGRLEFEQITFIPAAHPDYKLVMLLAKPR